MSSTPPADRPATGPTRAATSLGLVAAVVLLTASACSSSSGQAAPRPTAGSPASPTVADTYGALPTYLPTASPDADRELTGTVARPALTVEGDSVRARLPGGVTVRIVVSGPVVPGEGLPHATPAPTCTWTVVVSDATGPVRLSAAYFRTEDHLGATYPVALVGGRPRPPALLRPGRRTTFELRAVMPTGEGLMRWTPTGRPVALWDFVVEND